MAKRHLQTKMMKSLILYVGFAFQVLEKVKNYIYFFDYQ